jgi:hypothetical protein
MLPAGLLELIISFFIGGVIYFISTLFPNDIIKKLAMLVAILVIGIGLITFLRHYIS